MPVLRFIRLIAQLKWQLTLRHFQRNQGGAAATGVVLAMFTVILVVVLTLTTLYLHNGGQDHRATAMFWGLWISSFLWISAPLSQVDAQRNLDLTGLRLLPLSRVRFTLAVLLDGLVSPLGLLTLPLWLGLCAAFTLRWAELPLVVLSVLLLGLFQLGCAQALYLFGNRILTSRRFTELSMGCGFIIFMAAQVLNIALQSGGAHLPPWAVATFHTLRDLVAPIAQWIAPGVAARAVLAGAAGASLAALGLYALLAVQAGAALALAGLAAKLFYEGELESGGQVREGHGPAAAQQTPGGLTAVWSGWGVSPLLVALMRREQAYLWRDPAVKLQLMQSLFATLYLAFAIVMLNFRQNAELLRGWLDVGGKYVLLGVALMLGLSESSVLFNRFGYEGGQLASLLLTPVSRRTLLAGKSLFLVSHFALLNLLLCFGLGIALHAPPQYIILALVLVVCNTMLLDVIGYYVSIFYPFAYRRAGRRMRAVMPQPGCGYVLVYLLVFNLSNLLAFPISFISALCVVLLGWPGLALAVLWSGGACLLAYRFALPHAALQLEQREPQLLAALAKGAE